MSDMQPEPHTTANYILIFILTMVAFSGTLYLIYHALNKPPFDLELSMEFATKKGIHCASQKLMGGNIPYEIVEFREKEWIVLGLIEDRKALESILINECSD